MARNRPRSIAQLPNDKRAASAVEFAFIAPVMILAYFGLAELCGAMLAERKASHTASAIGDLVAQSTSIHDSDMTNIFNAASSILTPYSNTPLHAKVTAVNIDASLNATVAWSSALNTSARAVGSTVTIPTGLKLANSQLIWAEVSYDFVPPVSRFIIGTLTLSDQFFARPRQSSTICRPPTVTVCS